MVEINWGKKNYIFDSAFRGFPKMEHGSIGSENNLYHTIQDFQVDSLTGPYDQDEMDVLEIELLRVFFWCNTPGGNPVRIKFAGRYFGILDDYTYACHPAEFLLLDEKLKEAGCTVYRSNAADWFIWGGPNQNVVFLPKLTA